ncbi:MAG: hypothetical protein LBD24_05110 [Spirochaetaceae bacterium]|nr:hypothetical protein [Spirochaetaceae bacterium]
MAQSGRRLVCRAPHDAYEAVGDGETAAVSDGFKQLPAMRLKAELSADSRCSGAVRDAYETAGGCGQGVALLGNNTRPC